MVEIESNTTCTVVQQQWFHEKYMCTLYAKALDRARFAPSGLT